MLDKTGRIIMMKKYLAQADEERDNAIYLKNGGRYKKVLHCCYYAIFNLISGIMLSEGFEFSSHEQLLGEFNRRFIYEKNILPDGGFKKIKDLFNNRHFADYSPGDQITSEECDDCLMTMDAIFKELTDYLNDSIKSLERE